MTDVKPIEQESLKKTTWQVTTVAVGTKQDDQELGNTASPSIAEYDAVVICNGHYTVPRMPAIEGLSTYPGKVEHSHLYRRPEKYAKKCVLIIGAFASGVTL